MQTPRLSKLDGRDILQRTCPAQIPAIQQRAAGSGNKKQIRLRMALNQGAIHCGFPILPDLQEVRENNKSRGGSSYSPAVRGRDS